MIDPRDPRLRERRRPVRILLTKDGHECRDRLPWGGITWPSACSCVGRCQVDEERAKEEQ